MKDQIIKLSGELFFNLDQFESFRPVYLYNKASKQWDITGYVLRTKTGNEQHITVKDQQAFLDARYYGVGTYVHEITK